MKGLVFNITLSTFQPQLHEHYIWQLSAFICLVMWEKKEACVYTSMKKTNQTRLAFHEWSLDSGFAALSQANSTAASFSSTSYETRGYIAH